MKEIDQVRDHEESNYRTARSALGDSISLLDRMYELYDSLGVGARKVPLDRKLGSVIQFMLSSRYQLTLGGLAVLRGHPNDASFFLRRAIEICAFAVRVVKHPHLADFWLEAGDNDEAYDKYRSKFRPGKLFPDDEASLGTLYTTYDRCSKLIHPSIYSFAGQLNVSKRNSGWTMSLNYFRLPPAVPSEPVASYFWLIDTHIEIVRMFFSLLNTLEGFASGDIGAKLDSVGAELRRNLEEWQPVIKP